MKGTAFINYGKFKRSLIAGHAVVTGAASVRDQINKGM
jgi:hypothetical protein